MSIAKQFLKDLINEIPENDVLQVIDYIEYLKTKKEKTIFKELLEASESSLEFWNNDADDEVWNNV